MKRSSRTVWLALCALLVGCSSIVDFDRSKIGADDDAGGTADGGMDAMVDARVPDAAEDTAVPDATVDSGPECTVDTDCEDNELCCNSMCRVTSELDGCQACNEACGANSSVCEGRACLCGTSPACSGATPFCEAAAPGEVERCVECQGDSDCTARTDGKEQCVAGACVECDSADEGSGCENPKPSCESTTSACVGCDTTHVCANGMTCVSGSCFGCNPVGNVGCVATGSTPICKPVPNMPGVFQCVGCANDGECPSTASQCVGGSCERCDAAASANNAGCTPASATPICDDTLQTCRACGAGDCSGTTPQCSDSGATAGRCVQCRSSAACTTASAPVCDPADGVCKACAAPGGDAACTAANKGVCDEVGGTCVTCTDDAQCAGNAGGFTHCNIATHSCVGCRPSVAADCGGTTPVCNPTLLVCQGCTADAQCGGATPACNTTTGACVACRAGGATACAGARPVCDAASNTCIVCDATNAGCGGVNNQCLVVAGAAASNSCVDCINDQGCTSSVTLDKCNTTTHACVDCLLATDCVDSNMCTSSACTGNVCSFPAIPVVDDGLACTTDGCDPLLGMTHTSTCPADDGFTCTTGAPTCGATGCTYPVNPTACSADMCVTGSTCVGAGAGGAPVTGCTAGTPVVCPTDAGACVPATGCPP